MESVGFRVEAKDSRSYYGQRWNKLRGGVNTVFTETVRGFGVEAANRLISEVSTVIGPFLASRAPDVVKNVFEIMVVPAGEFVVTLYMGGLFQSAYRDEFVLKVTTPELARQIPIAGAIWKDTVAAFVYLLLGYQPTSSGLSGQPGFRFITDDRRDSASRDFVDELMRQQRIQIEREMAALTTAPVWATPEGTTWTLSGGSPVPLSKRIPAEAAKPAEAELGPFCNLPRKMEL